MACAFRAPVVSLLAVLLAPLMARGEVPAGRPRLRSPIDVEARRAVVGRPLPPPPADPILPPVRDVEGVSYYTDTNHSIPDPARQRENAAALAPLRRYVGRVVALSDGWMTSRPAQPAYAARAIEALAAWARAGALLGDTNRQGATERAWTLGSLALAYLKVREAPAADRAAREAIEAWLASIARVVRDARPARSNNLAYWAGLAVAAAGVAADDRTLFDWGMEEGRLGVNQIRADGFLPLELARKGRALHYHLFALAPLLMLGELAEKNGVSLEGPGGGALHRLGDRVIGGLGDPTAFVTAAGAPQEAPRSRDADLAWAEIYFARFQDPRLPPLLRAARPLEDVRLGGDLTAMFGASLAGDAPRPNAGGL